jgi:hypothetical protein
MSERAGEHNGSSIPIPPDAARAMLAELVRMESTGEAIPAVGDLTPQESVMWHGLSAASPKLYEAWAESRVDVVAEALFNRDHVRELWPDAPARERERYEALARRSLGLGDRS